MTKLYNATPDGMVELTEEEATELKAWQDKINKDLDATKYARDRKGAYPSYADQFDQIFHEGIDKWKDTIKAVKDAHPKP